MGVVAQLADEMERRGYTKPDDPRCLTRADIVRLYTLLTAGAFMLRKLQEQQDKADAPLENPNVDATMTPRQKIAYDMIGTLFMFSMAVGLSWVMVHGLGFTWDRSLIVQCLWLTIQTRWNQPK